MEDNDEDQPMSSERVSQSASFETARELDEISGSDAACQLQMIVRVYLRLGPRMNSHERG
jgi:hypothetical protein